MLWLIDSCQNKVSADQYYVTMLQARVNSSLRSCNFLNLTADQVLVFRLDCRLKQGYYSAWGRREHMYVQRQKFRHELTPDALLTFFQHISCTIVSWKVIGYVIVSTILEKFGILIGYTCILFKFNWKKGSKTTC